MAERNSWAVSEAGGLLTVEDSRLAVGALVAPAGAVTARTGLRPAAGDPARVLATGTPDGWVHVQPFQLVLQTGRAGAGGVYLATLDAIKDVNVLATPADPTHPRDDLIVAQQSDQWYSDPGNEFVVRHVVGTPSATPSDPAVDGSPDWVLLARVRVAANATEVTQPDITHPAVPQTVALGGLLPVPSQAARDALTGAYPGMPVWRTDRQWTEVYDGSGWRVQGVAVVASTGDLASAVTSPYAGQVAYNTGDGMLYRWSGTEWSVAGVYRRVQTLASSAASVTFDNIPETLRSVEVSWTTRDDWAGFTAAGVFVRVNNSSASVYENRLLQSAGGAGTAVTHNYTWGGNRAQIGISARASAVAGRFGAGRVVFPTWAAAHGRCHYLFDSTFEAASNVGWMTSGGGHFSGAGPYTRLDFFPEQGGTNFVAGSSFTLIGRE